MPQPCPQVLTAARLWESLIAPDDLEAKRQETKNFEALIARVLEDEAGLQLQAAGVFDRNTKSTQDRALRLARQIRLRLIATVPLTYDYVDTTLKIDEELEKGMLSMSTVQFENVLHPIFQEDELTLVLVGAALGGMAGFMQVPFY